MPNPQPYYKADLAWVHHQGFSSHADSVAPGILRLLQPVLDRGGTVVELGCGSGLLTRHLVAAGHHVIATDASPAMLDMVRDSAPDVAGIRRLTLPDDPIPECDAVVGCGHALNYLPDEDAIHGALRSAARALRPGGVLAVDICDLHYGESRKDTPYIARVAEDWAIFTQFQRPAPQRFIREITTFVRSGDDADAPWRRDDERHDNVLLDTATLPALLAEEGVTAAVGDSFGGEAMPDGLYTLIGRKG